MEMENMGGWMLAFKCVTFQYMSSLEGGDWHVFQGLHSWQSHGIFLMAFY